MPDDSCQHLWIYDYKTYTTMYYRCRKCGITRPCDLNNEQIRPFANIVARELNIRHDDRDGDV